MLPTNVNVADASKKISSFFTDIFSPSNNPFFYWLIIGSAVFLFLFLFYWIRRKCNRDIVIIKNTNGKVKISQDAIKQMIYRSVSFIKGIGKMKASIKVHRSSLSIRLKIYPLSNYKFNTIYGELQKVIENSLKDHLGFKKIGSIDILVKKVINDSEVNDTLYQIEESPKPKTIHSLDKEKPE